MEGGDVSGSQFCPSQFSVTNGNYKLNRAKSYVVRKIHWIMSKTKHILLFFLQIAEYFGLKSVRVGL